ncbi:MAG: hypothetical protein AB8B80_16305 [Marinicellaceae bacterium]
MKRVVLILSLVTLLPACVFNIKIPPEEKTQTDSVSEREESTTQSFK